jgi:hypothetical protein
MLDELPPPLAEDAPAEERELREAALAAATAALAPLEGPDGIAFDDLLHLAVADVP